MGNEDHRFLSGKCMDFPHNVVLALHINIGSGFVKNIHRAVMEQRPRQRKPLALTARQVRGFFRKGRIKPVLGFQKPQQVHPP